ncbi:MAG: glycosyltransferase, partial [Magnetospirillum sp.]
GVHPGGDPDVLGWALANGAPADAIADLGWLSRERTRALLWECDVGLFPNRCEGGTNNVAQEAMACGLPVIVSANTGHLDLIDGDNVFALASQGPVPGPGRQDWGESAVDEMVETLERLYADRAEARRRAALGLAFIRRRTWRDFSDIVINATLGRHAR